MSAISSNSGDRDFDDLRRAQRAYEPSMDEILASIRNIIADEREPAKAPAPKAAPQRPVAGPQIVYSNEAVVSDRVAPEPAERPEPAPTPAPAPDSNAPKVVWRQPEPASSDGDEVLSVPAEELLLSREADEVVSAAFGALSANLAARSAEIADGIVREMLRPMLKAWLDENLPSIVERLVRAEIQRVARGPR
jgi:cell pole-organizing protein PopZ